MSERQTEDKTSLPEQHDIFRHSLKNSCFHSWHVKYNLTEGTCQGHCERVGFPSWSITFEDLCITGHMEADKS